MIFIFATSIQGLGTPIPGKIDLYTYFVLELTLMNPVKHSKFESMW